MRKDRKFMMGYSGETNVVYGRDCVNIETRYVTPLTLSEAKKILPTMLAAHTVIIYELVPIPTKKEKK